MSKIRIKDSWRAGGYLHVFVLGPPGTVGFVSIPLNSITWQDAASPHEALTPSEVLEMLKEDLACSKQQSSQRSQ